MLPGRAAPLGATLTAGGVNFSVYAKAATRVELLLFAEPESPLPSHVFDLSSPAHRSFDYFHALIPGIGAGQTYAYRVHGPHDPARGMEFDGEKLLIDPYGRLVATPAAYDRGAGARPGDNTASSLRSVVVDMDRYDWEGDEPLGRPFADSIIYELHVKGFTAHASSGVGDGKAGTYLGLVEKIPYLKALGITAVELLPVFSFDASDAPQGRTNYWGYSPVSFFSVHTAYSSDKSLMGPVNEFRDMVKAFHRAGIEVLLDVVYNHTAEGSRSGPTQSLRGFHSGTYYLYDGERFSNYSGTGNSLNASHSVTRRLIQDSLRFWVEEMHVDGFRFDLASILTRDVWGRPQDNPHTIYSIETDPVLATTKLIAEPWDAMGLYQVGSFAGDRWREWNGKFRDDIRSFVKGDPRVVRTIPNRLLASPDLYQKDDREPDQSVNFVSCHDGFTLNDLVSYDEKHNEANGEENRDGDNHNRSWNHGVEGPSDDPQIESLRLRQIKNFFTLTLVSSGVPMLSMGDEARRTQLGNNNAYCQDNELSYFDWSLVSQHQGLVRFVQELTQWRLRFRPRRRDGDTLEEVLHRMNIQWHGVKLFQPDWSDGSRALSLSIGEGQMHLIFNALWEPLEFELPICRSGAWRRLVDTSQASPHDIYPHSRAPVLEHQSSYLVEARTSLILVA